MTAAGLLADLRKCGVYLWRDGDLLRVNAPKQLATHELRSELAQHKAELLAELEEEVQTTPILETRVLVRTRAGVEVVEVQPIDPPGPTRWEKHLVRGVVALVGDVTTDQSVAQRWIRARRPADSGDEGAA